MGLKVTKSLREGSLESLNSKDLSETDRSYLKGCSEVKPVIVTLPTILAKSENFPIQFPVNSMRSKEILKTAPPEQHEEYEKRLEENANSSYIIIHEKVIILMINFLKHKTTYGTPIEKELYKEMEFPDFITRLFSKRAIQFVGPLDSYQILSGKKGYGGWDLVGTSEEKPPLILKDCLSYDEIKISALLAVSCPSYFINTGSRTNNGIVNTNKDHQEWGIVIGMVGCRFEVPGVMEWQEMILTAEQNTIGTGYGNSSTEFENQETRSNRKDFLKIWAKFYNREYFPDFDNFSPKSKSYYLQIRPGVYFDADIYQQRCRMSAELILLEANHRAQENQQKAFVHIVGFGLGVWKISDVQTKYFLQGFEDALISTSLPNISDVYFSWFRLDSTKKMENGKTIGTSKIMIHFGKRDPHERLTGDNLNKLLVVTYAWDGNGMPGNEFWGGSLSGSGDPAEACSSQIAELQNPHINSNISGNNAKVVSPATGLLLPLPEFVESTFK